jgi:leucyl/phenylalanyl-tRNA---protein transferase
LNAGQSINTRADVKRFTSRYNFPPTDSLGEEMYLGAGADLEVDTLLYAYSHGFFPWYEKAPILWCSPPQRMILRAGEIRINRSMRRHLKKTPHTIKKDAAFDEVIRNCAHLREETWITPEMISAYTRLFELGWAHSWETYLDDRLVGGIYGVVMGRAAFLESTFHLEANAGKEAFLAMYEDLTRSDAELFDFQVHSEIAESFGAYEVSRTLFEEYLRRALA